MALSRIHLCLVISLILGLSSVVNAFQNELCLSKLVGTPPDSSVYTIVVEHPVHSNWLIFGSKGGQLILYERETDGSLTLQSSFLDVSGFTSTENERGLLGLAFHPDFRNNGRVFVSRSCGASSSSCTVGSNVIEEYVISNPSVGNRVSNAALPTIIEIPQPYMNHNGGQILFSPDGYLMVMVGDGGSYNDPAKNAQNRDTMLGKILRLDVDNKEGSNNYAIPSSNPFVNDDDTLNEIWALGLRNPWRCSFDREDMEAKRADAPLYCGVGLGLTLSG